MEQNDHHEKSLDLDVTPEGPYADQRPYPPKKKPGNGPVWIGIAVVAVIIIVTYFAFSGDKEADNITEPAPVTPTTSSAVDSSSSDLPDRAPDAVIFSPSPEMRAEEEAATSQTMVAATSAAGASESVQADENKPETKPVEKKPAATKSVEKKPVEKKPAATKKAETKAAEPKTDAAKTAEAKTASPEVADAKPAETKAADTKPTEIEAEAATGDKKNVPTETKPAEAGTTEAKPNGAESAEAKPAEVKTEVSAAEAKPAEPVAISDQWVVNISSTPDAAESLKLLTQVMASKAAGEQIYVYETTINGVPHHRIRIGFFASRAEAEAVGQRVKEEFKLYATPWAVQPTVDEVTRYKGN